MSDHFIQTAIKHHGVFKKAAHSAGMATQKFAEKHQHDSGVLGHRARLALTLMHLHHHDNMTAGGGSDEEADAAISAAQTNKKS